MQQTRTVRKSLVKRFRILDCEAISQFIERYLKNINGRLISVSITTTDLATHSLLATYIYEVNELVETTSKDNEESMVLIPKTLLKSISGIIDNSLFELGEDPDVQKIEAAVNNYLVDKPVETTNEKPKTTITRLNCFKNLC